VNPGRRVDWTLGEMREGANSGVEHEEAMVRRKRWRLDDELDMRGQSKEII